MKATRLDKSLTSALKELNQIIGRAFVLDEFLKAAIVRIEVDINNGMLPRMFMSTGIPLRDLTIPSKSEVRNFYMPPDNYKVTWENYKKEVEVIASREHLFYISQAYEILEQYLYDQVAEFVVVRGAFHLFVDAKTNKSTYASVRKALKTLDDRKNNRHLLRILRANSEVYAAHEKNNYYNLNLAEWYEMLGVIRHCITHNRMVIDKDTLNALPKYYTNTFEVREYDNNNLLFINHDHAMQQILRIGEFMFLVYKAIYQTCYSDRVGFEHLDSLFL